MGKFEAIVMARPPGHGTAKYQQLPRGDTEWETHGGIHRQRELAICHQPKQKGDKTRSSLELRLEAAQSRSAQQERVNPLSSDIAVMRRPRRTHLRKCHVVHRLHGRVVWECVPRRRGIRCGHEARRDSVAPRLPTKAASLALNPPTPRAARRVGEAICL
jgi:hypothetical protein